MKLLLALLLTTAFSGCSNLLYYPDRVEYTRPSSNTEVTHIGVMENGDILHAWYLASKPNHAPKGIVVLFHGNGQNLTAHHVALTFILSHGYDYLIFDYPGYGENSGTPTPENTVAAGKAAIIFADIRRKGFEALTGRKIPLIVYAQSLGSAISLKAAIDLQREAKEKHVNAPVIDLHVIDSGFLSYRGAAKSILAHSAITYPFQHLGWLLMSDKYAPGDDIQELHSPLVVIHGTADQVIDANLGEQVFKLANEPKELWLIDGANHIMSLWAKDVDVKGRLIRKFKGIGK